MHPYLLNMYVMQFCLCFVLFVCLSVRIPPQAPALYVTFVDRSLVRKTSDMIFWPPAPSASSVSGLTRWNILLSSLTDMFFELRSAALMLAMIVPRVS